MRQWGSKMSVYSTLIFACSTVPHIRKSGGSKNFFRSRVIFYTPHFLLAALVQPDIAFWQIRRDVMDDVITLATDTILYCRVVCNNCLAWHVWSTVDCTDHLPPINQTYLTGNSALNSFPYDDVTWCNHHAEPLFVSGRVRRRRACLAGRQLAPPDSISPVNRTDQPNQFLALK